MKVKDLLNYLNSLSDEILEKELNFYDYKNKIAYDSPAVPTVVDESDEYYLDLVFNYQDDR